jgi:hypothetical protein
MVPGNLRKGLFLDPSVPCQLLIRVREADQSPPYPGPRLTALWIVARRLDDWPKLTMVLPHVLGALMGGQPLGFQQTANAWLNRLGTQKSDRALQEPAQHLVYMIVRADRWNGKHLARYPGLDECLAIRPTVTNF